MQRGVHLPCKVLGSRALAASALVITRSASEINSLSHTLRCLGMPPGRSSSDAPVAPASASSGAAAAAFSARGAGGGAGGGGDEDHVREIVETCLLTDDLTPLLRLILVDGSSGASKGRKSRRGRLEGSLRRISGVPMPPGGRRGGRGVALQGCMRAELGEGA